MKNQFNLRALIVAFALATLTSCGHFVFKVGSPAMESTLPVGSRIFINSYATYKKGDLIAFKSTTDGQAYVFRLIALPGETVQMKAGEVYVNGTLQVFPKTIKHGYFVLSDKQINKRVFEQLEIPDFFPMSHGGYFVNATKDQINQLKEKSFVNEVNKAPYQSGKLIYPDFQDWDSGNLGPVYLPDNGDTLQNSDFNLYKNLIAEIEGVELAEQDQYICKQGYCFVLGDNRDNALDSRFIGLIPTENILGEATLLF